MRKVKNWIDLPEQAMARVLKGLPFLSLLALRCVGKKWGAIIISHASICSPNPTSRHCLLVSNGNRKDYICYPPLKPPLKDRWIRGSLFPTEISISETLHLCGSAGGLLLFVDGDSFIVLNPLTKNYKRLPKIHTDVNLRRTAIGICYHAAFKSYMIVVARSDSGKSTSRSFTALYNSLLGSWTMTRGMKGKKFTPGCRQLSYSNGSFFGSVCSTKFVTPTENCEEYSLARYTVQQQTWTELSLPRTSFPYLGEVDGQILLATRHNLTEKVSLWEMSHAEGTWNLVKGSNAKVGTYCNYLTVPMIFSGDFIFWEYLGSSDVLVQNMKLDSWAYAPKLPEDFAYDRGSVAVEAVKYVAFAPSLTAAP